MCDRGVDIKRLPCDTLLLLRRQILQCAHIVKTVNELDQYDAHILCHGDQYLSMVDCLVFFFIREFQIGDLGDRFNDLIDLFAEFLDEIFFGDIAVFDHIVKKSCTDGMRIGPELGKFVCDIQTMNKIRLTG